MDKPDPVTNMLLADILNRLKRLESIGNSIGNGILWILLVLMFIGGTLVLMAKHGIQ
jgi:hypothetical protein